MKKIFVLPILIITFLIISNSANYAQDDPTTWKYFKMLVTVSDDSMFVKIQDECKIGPPYLSSYTLNIDIGSDNPDKQVIIFGDQNLSDSPRYPWSTLSKDVQDGLIKWNKSNKIKLE